MIKSINDLEAIKASQQFKLAMREGHKRLHVIVEMGDKGIALGAKEILNYFIKKFKEQLILDCAVMMGPSVSEEEFYPVIEIRESNKITKYRNVTTEIADEIINKHILKGEIVISALLSQTVEDN